MNTIEPSSIISVGNYEILYASAPEWDEVNKVVDQKKVIQYLNNAHVQYCNIDLKININWFEKGQSISSIDFIMPKDEAKLSDIFITTPYGLIKKNRTGIGATTLELNSPRNSIIVVPTRTLAYEKAKNSRINESNKYKILYVGGDINGFIIPKIEDYLSDENIFYKKFIVVANSLPNLLQKIGKENYQNYFFMVDEIDSYQYDSSYRPELENVIDYYFQFPPIQRCLVSATVGSFSNSKIEEEPIINVEFNAPLPRNITLLHSENVVETAKKQIEAILAEHPNDKILVAYNAVTKGILPIIKSLEQEYQSRSAVLCSIKSKPHIEEYYSEILDRHLPKQLTFMTCTYFVGIDIDEPFHLISIADTSYPYTLLSENKLQQIAGRCRVVEGLLSETIIYNSKEREPIAIKEIHQQIIDDTNLLITYTNSIPQVKRRFSNIIKPYNEIEQEEIIKYSSKNYHGTSNVALVRTDVNNIIKPAFFNIDNLLIQLELLQTLYATKEALPQKLREQGHHVNFQEAEVDNKQLNREIQDEIEAEVQQTQEEERQNIIQKLRESENITTRERLIYSLKMTCTRQNSIFLERFIELQKYVPFEPLVEKLPSYDNSRNYNNFYNSVLFWALAEDHPLRRSFNEEFPLDTPLTGDILTAKFNTLWQGILNYRQLSNKQAIPIIRIFCKLSERTSMRIDGREQPIGAYKIISYDTLDFNCEPLEKISANTNMTRVFKF